MKYILSFILSLLALAGFAQHMDQATLVAAGASQAIPGTEVVWSLGELTHGLYADSEIIVSQGMFQPMAVITALIPESVPLAATIFPNPTQGKLNILLEDSNTYYFDIKSVTGKTLLGINITSSAQSATLDLTGITSGLYLLQITNQRGDAFLYKIVKTH